MYADRIGLHHSVLDQTDIKYGYMKVDGDRRVYMKWTKLPFILENIDKSRNKLIDKMNGN